MQNLTDASSTGMVNSSVATPSSPKPPTEAVTNPTAPTPETEKGPVKKQIPIKTVAVISSVVIVAGSATGWLLYGLTGSPSSSGSQQAIQQIPGSQVAAGDIFGSNDMSTFPDTAEGYLQSGGINGEGSHSLLRPGGESQTVYLTSTVTDLNKLVGMQVKVWGETYKGQQAGWLMDVGRVEVIDPNAAPPESAE